MKKITRNVFASAMAGVSFCVNPAAKRERENDDEGEDEAEDELRETLPNFRKLRLLDLFDVDVVGPDIGQQKSPHADEDVDEDFYGRGGREDPARFVFDALAGRPAPAEATP